ncbi:CCG-binding protein 1 [Mercurialis annua]|uniref:CCG-binding protein 1 n=1 Tax=Mercurialis annua TaxID=3986 RepID=UPI0021610B06|nr:CCG-binding protein 1 [Mercurialis annua]
MMIKSIIIQSSSPLAVVESKDFNGCTTANTSKKVCLAISCSSSSSSRSSSYIPKLQPFSRTKLERAVKSPPLIQKCENELSDYCSTLEGDDSYSCWRAYFELKDLERESPKEDVEKLILQAGGVKFLIGCLHGISSMLHKGTNTGIGFMAPSTSAKKEKETRPCPIPDGLPKSQEELDEEEEGRMPDSPFTRLLRSKGRFPAWYSPAPDHETD